MGFVVSGVFADSACETKVPLGSGSSVVPTPDSRRTKIRDAEREAEAAFGVLGAEECFYLAGWKVRFKAVIKTKIWQETVLSVGSV